MFISANFLAIQYGVDDKVARFFADREPPANNLYWKNKLLYLRPEPGWLFIPLIVDLLLKNGIERSHLLSEEFVSLLEQVGHIAALEETKQLTWKEAISACKELVKDSHKNPVFYKNVVNYMEGGADNPFATSKMPFSALHRGDVFLFSLCALQIDDSMQEKLMSYWFALISTLLLLDDAEDMSNDKKTGEPNAFLQSGLAKEGIAIIVELVRNNLKLIATVNKSMAAKLDEGYTSLNKLPHIKQLLNQ